LNFWCCRRKLFPKQVENDIAVKEEEVVPGLPWSLAVLELSMFLGLSQATVAEYVDRVLSGKDMVSMVGVSVDIATAE